MHGMETREQAVSWLVHTLHNYTVEALEGPIQGADFAEMVADAAARDHAALRLLGVTQDEIERAMR